MPHEVTNGGGGEVLSSGLPEGSSLYDFHQKVSRTFRAQRAHLRPMAASLGLGSGQPRILSFVAARGAATQSDIARFFSIDPAAVSRMLETLRRNGFVTVTQQEGNRRANVVELTKRGHETIRVWDRACVEVEATMLAGFSPEERAQFGEYLDRALANLVANSAAPGQAGADADSALEEGAERADDAPVAPASKEASHA